MSSEQFIDDLLHASDPTSRRVLLDTHFEFINLETIQRLKERADKMERDDAHLALQLSQAAGEMADRLDSDEARGLALWMEANAHDYLTELDPAAHSYERAADHFKKAGKELEAARTNIGLMSTLMKIGDFGRVLALAESARPVFLQHGDTLSLAKVEMNLGVLHYQQGQYSLGRDAFKRAVEAFEALGDPLYAAMNKINQANSMTMLDDFMGAEQLHEQARPVFEKAELRAAAGSVEHDLAYLKYARGNYAEAYRDFEHARDIFAGLSDQVNTAMTDLEESDLHLDLNLPEAALGLAKHAGQAFKEIGMPFEQARAQLNQAVALARTGQRELSVPLLEEAHNLFVSQGNAAWAAHSDLQRAEIIGQNEGQREQARLLLKEALKTYEKLELKTKQAYTHIISANFLADDCQWLQAEQELQNASSAISPVVAPWLEQRIEVCAGRIFEATGQPDLAIQHYQRAADKTEEMSAALTAEEHRTAFVADKLAPYEALVTLLADRDPSAAFQWAERAKSRALVDLLAAGVRPRLHLGNEVDVKRTKRLQELREELNWLYTRLTRGAAPGESGAPVAGADTFEKIQEREQEATSLWRELQARHPETISLIRSVSQAPGDIQASLPAGTGLVEYFIARGQISAFLLTKEKLQVYPQIAALPDVLPLLENLAFQFSKFQFGPGYYQRHRTILLGSTQEILAELGQKLMGSIQKHLAPLENLIIVPHGPLHALPFQALRLDDRYLLEKYAISYAPSAAVMKYCKDKSLSAANSSPSASAALLVGVPDERASHVNEEIQELQKLFKNAEILLGEEATFERVKQSARTCDIFHLAAHGLFRPGAALLSSIHLADRWLAVQDIYNLDLKASLVALSACETGLGHDAGGDDMVGLVRGFLYAGASSLLVSLWMVDDESMAQLMTVFYTGWLAGLPKARALQKAQLALLKTYEHPYYWAPLILVGNER